MHAFKATNYPSQIRQPILMVAAGMDSVVSTPAIEEFAYHLRAGSHLVIPGAKHEILQEQEDILVKLDAGVVGYWNSQDPYVISGTYSHRYGVVGSVKIVVARPVLVGTSTRS